MRQMQLKNVCHIETNVNFKLYRTITLDWTRLCSCFKVHFVALIEEEMKLCISHFLLIKVPLRYSHIWLDRREGNFMHAMRWNWLPAAWP